MLADHDVGALGALRVVNGRVVSVYPDDVDVGLSARLDEQGLDGGEGQGRGHDGESGGDEGSSSAVEVAEGDAARARQRSLPLALT